MEKHEHENENWFVIEKNGSFAVVAVACVKDPLAEFPGFSVSAGPYKNFEAADAIARLNTIFSPR